MRYAARVDKNQTDIVQALRDAGAYVWILGLPVDLLVGYNNHTFLVEIKDGPRKHLTRLQQDFFGNWMGGTLCRINDVDGALRMIGVKHDT
jgi:hypothetical protein